MSTPVYDIGNDVIDQLSGLEAGSPLFALRHQREKVAVASQGSYDTLFDPTLEGIGLDERLLVAVYASRLAGATDLAKYYSERAQAASANAAQLAAAESGEPEQLEGEQHTRVRAMLVFTRALTKRPVEGDKAAIEKLPAAGISTPAVVALSQLIAFVSYQLRVIAGLKAMKLAGVSAPAAN